MPGDGHFRKHRRVLEHATLQPLDYEFLASLRPDELGLPRFEDHQEDHALRQQVQLGSAVQVLRPGRHRSAADVVAFLFGELRLEDRAAVVLTDHLVLRAVLRHLERDREHGVQRTAGSMVRS